MIKNKLLTALVIVGMFSLTVEPYIASAQTPDGTSTSGASVLLNENFDGAEPGGVPDGWSKTGFWGGSYVGSPFGSVLYGDYTNFPYANNGGSGTVTSPTFDLNGATSATISFVTRCDTDYTPNADFMTLQASGDNGSSFSDLISWNEATIDTDTDPTGFATKNFTDISVPSNLLTSTFKLGFKWQTDTTDESVDGVGADGCLIDDVVLTKVGGGSTTLPTDTGTTTPPTDTGTTTPPTDTGTSTPPTDNGTTTPPTDNGTTTPPTDSGTTTPPTDTGTTTPPTDNSTYTLSACGPLNNEGTYNLSKDISATSTCFYVNVNNITIDGKGHTISGTNASGISAVVASDKTGLTIKNLKATGFDQAISLSQVSNSTFDSNTLNGNNYAFVLHGGNTNVIKNTIANDNQNVGIYVQHTSGTTISGNTTNNNAVGINLDAANGNTVTNNTANMNDRGILLLTSSNNTVTANTANQNAFGIALETTSEQNTISNNTQNGNGVGIAVGSGHNTLSGLKIDSSTSKAIRFYEGNSTDNVLNNITITNTGADGYDVSFDAANGNSAAAAVNGTVFNNTPIGRYIISPAGIFTFKNVYGAVDLLQGVSGSGINLSNDLKIETGKITIASSTIFANTDIRLTLNNTTATSSQILKNGIPCGDCSEFATLSNAISFRTHGAGIYTTTGVTTAPPPTDTGTTTPPTDTGTSTPPTDNGTTTPPTDNGTTTPPTDNGTTTPPTDTGTTTPPTDNGTTTPTDNGTTTQNTASSTDTTTTVTSSGGGGGGYYILTSSTPGSADLNNDGRVDFIDFNILMRNWESFFTGVGDINNDLRVDILDLSQLVDNWSR